MSKSPARGRAWTLCICRPRTPSDILPLPTGIAHAPELSAGPTRRAMASLHLLVRLLHPEVLCEPFQLNPPINSWKGRRRTSIRMAMPHCPVPNPSDSATLHALTHGQCTRNHSWLTWRIEKVLWPLAPPPSFAGTSFGPRTPPLGFWRAVMRPNRMASRTDVGTCALHNSAPAWKKALRSRGMSRRGCRCSTVIPEGPPAAPLLADLKFRQNPNSSKLKSACGSGLDNSLGSGVRGWRGRLVGSLNALRVASDPGARDDPSNACRAEETSPMCTNASALLTLFDNSSTDLRVLRRRRTATCWFSDWLREDPTTPLR